MTRPSARRPRRAGAARRTKRSWRRAALAVAALAAAVAAVLLLARRPRPAGEPPEPAASPAAVDVVREAAGRFGCPAERVVADAPGPGGQPTTVTVHAPRGFPAGKFALEVQARAHNAGGRLDPKPLGERGGYGLARLEGTLAGTPVRILVLGDEPRPAPRAAAPRAPAQRASPRLAIVLDDAGYSLPAARELAELPREVAVAVLPNAPHSAAVADELARQGREILLHMPMEPLPDHGPGPGDGAVMVGLADDEIADRVLAALDVVEGARGVNNHMGSRATADRPTMNAVMRFLKSRGLYFLDSRTTADSVAEAAARANGVPALRREVFLDIVDEPRAVERAVAEAVARAAADGEAVAIGHVHPVTVAVLKNELGSLPVTVKLVRPSELAR